MIKNIISTSHPINSAAQLFAGRTNATIAGLAIDTDKDSKLSAEIITGDATKADRTMTIKFDRKDTDVAIGGIFQSGNTIFITGDEKLKGYVGQKTELDMLAEGFQTLRDAKTGKRADSLLLWGPNDVTIARMKGRWVVLEDKDKNYVFHVFGANPNTDDVYAFRSMNGRKSAIVAGTVKNGKLVWRTLREEPRDKAFNAVSKIIWGKDEMFHAHVTTMDGLTVPMTIDHDGRAEFGRPIKWDGQILAPWFDQDAKRGAMPAGLFTGNGDKLTFTPTSKVKDKSVLAYLKAAC